MAYLCSFCEDQMGKFCTMQYSIVSNNRHVAFFRKLAWMSLFLLFFYKFYKTESQNPIVKATLEAHIFNVGWKSCSSVGVFYAKNLMLTFLSSYNLLDSAPSQPSSWKFAHFMISFLKKVTIFLIKLHLHHEFSLKYSITYFINKSKHCSFLCGCKFKLVTKMKRMALRW